MLLLDGYQKPLDIPLANGEGHGRNDCHKETDFGHEKCKAH